MGRPPSGSWRSCAPRSGSTWTCATCCSASAVDEASDGSFWVCFRNEESGVGRVERWIDRLDTSDERDAALAEFSGAGMQVPGAYAGNDL